MLGGRGGNVVAGTGERSWGLYTAIVQQGRVDEMVYNCLKLMQMQTQPLTC